MDKNREHIVYKNGEGGYIFISHSHDDFSKVRIIRNILEENGYEPLCFFLKCLNDDSEIEGLIKREISSRDIFLYIESQNSLKSSWVKKERKYIDSIRKSEKKTIFTITLDEQTDLEYETYEIINRTRVFISYAHQDQWAFDLLKQKLIEKDLRVFDYRNMKAGSNWALQLGSTIERMCYDGVFVLFISENAVSNQQILSELEIARQSDVLNNIVPVMIGKTKIEGPLVYYVGTMQCYKLDDHDNKEQLDTIVDAIKQRFINK